MSQIPNNLADNPQVYGPSSVPRFTHSSFVIRHFVLLLASLFLLLASPAKAQYRPDLPDNSEAAAPPPNRPIVEKPNAQIPLDLAFTKSDGAKIKLADIFNGQKPVILSLVYFSCPNLCGFTQTSLLEFVRKSPHGIQLGKDYDIVVVSIDPDDTPAEAATKRKNYLKLIPLPETQPGFIYLTGAEANIKALADTSLAEKWRKAK